MFFSWSPSKPSWLAARKPVFIHSFTLGTHLTTVNKHTGKLDRRWMPSTECSDILQILQIKTRRWVSGSGRIVSCDRFKERMLDISRETMPI